MLIKYIALLSMLRVNRTREAVHAYSAMELGFLQPHQAWFKDGIYASSSPRNLPMWQAVGSSEPHSIVSSASNELRDYRSCSDDDPGSP
ncbi:hypothetical protein MRX96_059020 [Rhipicephalus microplus]